MGILKTWFNGLCIGFGAALLMGCGDPAEHGVAPLVQTADQAERQLQEMRARPVQYTGMEGVYYRGREKARPDCLVCHVPGKPPYRDPALPEGRDNHWNISMDHAEGQHCFECHIKENPVLLTSIHGAAVPIDEVYLNCAKCHSPQFKSWLGGAHGKRLSGWAETRVIANCSECHYAHAPRHGSEIPVAQPTLIPERLKELNHE